MKRFIQIAFCLSCARAAPPTLTIAPVSKDAGAVTQEIVADVPLGPIYVTRVLPSGTESYGIVNTEGFTEAVGKCRLNAPRGQRHGYILMSVKLTVSRAVVERGGVSEELAACVMRALGAVEEDPMLQVSELWYVRLT